jgi:hypothetical protein
VHDIRAQPAEEGRERDHTRQRDRVKRKFLHRDAELSEAFHEDAAAGKRDRQAVCGKLFAPEAQQRKDRHLPTSLTAVR